MNNTIFNQLEEKLGKGRIKQNLILAPYTTFKIGGPAEYYFQALTEDDIVNAIKVAHELSLPFNMLGGVSNVVLSDKGLPGLSVRNLYSQKHVVEETDAEVWLQVGSGYNMTRLAQETALDGYEGFEYHSGLPGTLGGGLFMNSKWTAHPPTHYIGDDLVKALLVNHTGETREESHEYFQFAYDYSILQQTKEIVLWAQFKMKKKDPAVLIQRTKEAMEYRKKTQPFGVATSGCFFQNINCFTWYS
jgi:UDP-N-acetylmuramate dehydrogenase